MEDFELYEQRTNGSGKGKMIGLLIIVGTIVALWYFGYLKIFSDVFSGQPVFLDYVPKNPCVLYWISNSSLAEAIFDSPGPFGYKLKDNGLLIVGFSEYGEPGNAVGVLFTKEPPEFPRGVLIKKLEDNVYVFAMSQEAIDEYLSYPRHLDAEVNTLVADLSKRYPILMYAHPASCDESSGVDTVIAGVSCNHSCTVEIYIKGNETAVKEGLDYMVQEFGEENIRTTSYDGWFVVKITGVSKEDLRSSFYRPPFY